MKFRYHIILIALIILQVTPDTRSVSAGELAQENINTFLTTVFRQSPPDPEYIWQTAVIKQKVIEILQRPYPGIRIKYWVKNNDTVWILEGMAKHKPVVAGIVVRDQKIIQLEILVHDNLWGRQVRNPDFTNQYINSASDENLNLTTKVDGISGATISVNEITRLARLALFLNKSRL